MIDLLLALIETRCMCTRLTNEGRPRICVEDGFGSAGLVLGADLDRCSPPPMPARIMCDIQGRNWRRPKQNQRQRRCPSLPANGMHTSHSHTNNDRPRECCGRGAQQCPHTRAAKEKKRKQTGCHQHTHRKRRKPSSIPPLLKSWRTCLL